MNAESIENALDQLLAACIANEDRHPLTPIDSQPCSPTELEQEIMERKVTRRASDIREQDIEAMADELHMLCRDPLGQAYRKAIRTLGERLFEIGGRDLMDASFDRLTGGCSLRAGILDHAWNGIGGVWWS